MNDEVERVIRGASKRKEILLVTESVYLAWILYRIQENPLLIEIEFLEEEAFMLSLKHFDLHKLKCHTLSLISPSLPSLPLPYTDVAPYLSISASFPFIFTLNCLHKRLTLPLQIPYPDSRGSKQTIIRGEL